LGKQLVLRGSPPATVVGIVRDLRDVSTVNASPRAYFPMLQFAYPSFEVVMRVEDEPSVAAARIAAAFVGSTMIPRPTVRTMAAIRDDATSTSRVGSVALSTCAAVALLLTSIGLYGLVAMWAARRRGEIGIRLALGATSGHVHGLLLSAATRLVGAGAVIGLVCAFGLVRLEQGMLGPILALGPATVLATTATFALIAGIAATLPAWRATRQPPAEVLRTLV
jgi:ABC-type antimicrobial peptide transport system permease subunit